MKRQKILRFFYKKFLKNFLFLRDPEKIHDSMVAFGESLGSSPLGKKLTSFLFNYQDSALEQKILGISFKNPVGLAAGFDKNARLTQIIGKVSFGFEEIGSATYLPCVGNQKPRLWRLKKSKGLIVNYGLKNDGALIIRERLNNLRFDIPIGVSVARTNSSEITGIENEIADYVKSFQTFANLGDYLALNISCPNTYGGSIFAEPTALEKLLNTLNRIDITKPVFIKLPPDINSETIDRIISLAEDYGFIKGFIISNLTKKRENMDIDKDELKKVDRGVGGISGKPLENLANELLSYIYEKTQGKYILIGCGGIFSAEDAYKKIKLGASLVQLITGMIFEGPQLISQINRGLKQLLRKDGLENISEAVGSLAKVR